MRFYEIWCFFEEWIYMKSTAMWGYFQYICKKVPF